MADLENFVDLRLGKDHEHDYYWVNLQAPTREQLLVLLQSATDTIQQQIREHHEKDIR